MTIRSSGDVSVGATLTATAAATAAIDALVAIGLPEVIAKLSGYVSLTLPSATLDISAQATAAAEALAEVSAEIAALPGGVGVAVAAGLAAGIAAQTAAQLAIKGISPALSVKVDATLAAIASLNVQATAGVTGPNVDLALIGRIAAGLEILKASIEAQAALSASIAASLAVGGLKVYRFDGDLATAGAELQAQITADGLHGEFHFVLLLPTTDAAWGALQATVKVS
jgi:hypothetical protein